MKRLLLFVFVALAALSVSAQQRLGLWTSYPSFASASRCGVASPPRVYAMSETGLLTYDLQTYEVGKLTKINGLTQTALTATLYQDGYYFVGYLSGDIDIVDAQTYEVANLPELRNTINVSIKTINAFAKKGNRLLCGFGNGLLEIDVNKREIKSFCKIRGAANVTVNDVTFFGGRIFVGTNLGIFTAQETERNLENPDVWVLNEAIGEQNVWRLSRDGDSAMYAVTGARYGASAVHRVSDQTATQVFELDGLSTFVCRAGKMAYSNRYAVAVVDQADLQQIYGYFDAVSYVSNGEGVRTGILCADLAFLDDNTLVMADHGNESSGLYVCDFAGNATRVSSNSPIKPLCTKVVCAGRDVYVCAGSVDEWYGRQYYGGWVYCYSDGVWSYDWRPGDDMMSMAVSPRDPSKIVACWYGQGLVTIKNKKFDYMYSAWNTPSLIPAFGTTIFVSSAAYDAEDNLYVANTFTANVQPQGAGIVMLTADSVWVKLDYADFYEEYGLCQVRTITPTSNGNVWLTATRCPRSGLAVFSTNGTPLDTSDDRYRCRYSTGSDKRFAGNLTISDENGENIAEVAYDVAEDQNGVLWVATYAGPVVFEDNDDVFDIERPVFKRVKIPRNDGTGLADYLLEGVTTTCIAVDGANRKWIGTLNNGVYLVSADGTETIEAFNTDNSPLPSNEITSIAISRVTGEVYIGTAEGLVSYRAAALEPA